MTIQNFIIIGIIPTVIGTAILTLLRRAFCNLKGVKGNDEVEKWMNVLAVTIASTITVILIAIGIEIVLGTFK